MGRSKDDARPDADTRMKKQSRDKKRDARFEAEALEHLDALYSMALRLTRNDRDAEDLVQDALVKAFRFRTRYEPGSNMKAWLFKILTRTFYNQVRKNRNIRKLEVEAEVGWHYERFISTASAAGRATEDLLLDAISSERLREAIDELPDDFRTVVLLCDVHGFSYKEIAEIVDCPVGTVMSRLYRSRRQLQKKLHVYAVELGLVPALPPAEEDAPATATSSGASDLDAYRKQRQVEK